MPNIKKITVTASIDLDIDQIDALRMKLEQEPHGSQSREKVWDQLQDIKTKAVARLHAELMAFEGTAKHQINELFKV